MKVQWTSHLKTDEEQERFKLQVQSAKPVLERLMQIIEAQEKGIDKIETGLNLFSTPGWEGVLAHYHGERAAFYRIKDLLNLDQQIIRPGE